MKVIAINGSPKKEGNTSYAIQVVAKELEREGIEVSAFLVSRKSR